MQVTLEKVSENPFNPYTIQDGNHSTCSVFESPVYTQPKIESFQQVEDALTNFFDNRVSQNYEVEENFIHNFYVVSVHYQDDTEIKLFTVKYTLDEREFEYSRFQTKDIPYKIRVVEVFEYSIYNTDDDDDDILYEVTAKERQTIQIQRSIREKECVICYENTPNVLYPDCMYVSTCTRCEEIQPIFKCPLCREEVMIKYII